MIVDVRALPMSAQCDAVANDPDHWHEITPECRAMLIGAVPPIYPVDGLPGVYCGEPVDHFRGCPRHIFLLAANGHAYARLAHLTPASSVLYAVEDLACHLDTSGGRCCRCTDPGLSAYIGRCPPSTHDPIMGSP